MERIVALQTKAMRNECEEVMEDHAQEMIDYLQDVTATWKAPNKPKWSVKKTFDAREITWELVAIRNKTPWIWIEKGTGRYGPNRAAYKIPKTPLPYPLRFRTGYKPKTMAPARYGVGPGKATGQWVAKYQVTHPGIKAREFTKRAVENLKPTMLRNLENAIRRGIRKSG